MSTVAFAGDGIKVVATSSGATITQAGENWGDPWPTPSSSIQVKNIGQLIEALQLVQREKRDDDDYWGR